MSKETQIPELDGIGLFRFAWRRLTSMRTAIFLLILLAVAAIPGSLFPQRTQAPMQVTQFFKDSPRLAKWLDRFSMFDVYGSPWFSAIYILLFISLIGCVLPRTIQHFQASRAMPSDIPNELSHHTFYRTWNAKGAELEIAKAWFKKKRFRVVINGESISAEKGFARETGNLLFHAALILILIGISFSSLFGMRGEAIVNVGERFVNSPTSYDSLSYGKLFDGSDLSPFMLTVDKFNAKYNLETSAPEDYTLQVSLLKQPSSQIEKKIIKVNSPMTIGSTRIYLQANGYSPVVTVRDSKGDVAFQGPVPLLPQDNNLRSTGAIKVPDAIPQVGFIASFLPSYARDEVNGGISVFPEPLNPRLLLAAWVGDLGLDSGIAQSVYRIDTSKMAQIGLKALKPGETFNYVGGSITFEGFVQWVNLSFVADPGKKFALFGGIVAILGLLSSLFIRRRRIWIRVTNSSVEIAGLASNAAPGLEVEMNRLIQLLKGEK